VGVVDIHLKEQLLANQLVRFIDEHIIWGLADTVFSGRLEFKLDDSASSLGSLGGKNLGVKLVSKDVTQTLQAQVTSSHK